MIARAAWGLVATASLSAAILAAKDIGSDPLGAGLSVVAFGSIFVTWRFLRNR